MTHRNGSRLRPLVAVVYRAPLMAEGVATALDGVADTRLLPAELDDLSSLLGAIRPDALVDDGDCRAARAHADEHSLPLFHVPVESAEDDVPSPESLRALVVGSLLAGQVQK